MKNEDKQIKLKEIFNRMFEIDIDKINPKLMNEDLLGDIFLLEPIDLVCLYMEVEKVFNMSIPESIIVDKKFSTIKDVENLVLAH